MNLPSFHDANLVSISWSGKDLTLGIHTPAEPKVMLRIDGVRYLRVDGLREGNIIDRVHLYESDQCVKSNESVADWVRFILFGWRTVQTSAPLSAIELVAVKNFFNEFALHRTQLLSLSQIYGCELACMCESVEVQT